jgi:hypothetical protein
MQKDMFIALMLISFAFKILYGALVLKRARDEELVREQNSRWVREIIVGVGPSAWSKSVTASIAPAISNATNTILFCLLVISCSSCI